MNKKLIRAIDFFLIILSTLAFVLLLIPSVSVDYYSEFYHISKHYATYNGYQAMFGINVTTLKYIQTCGLGIFTIILMVINLACAIISLVANRTLYKNIASVTSMLISLLVAIFFFRGNTSLITLTKDYNNTTDIFTNIKAGYIVLGIIFIVICVVELMKILFTPQPVSDKQKEEEMLQQKKEEEMARLKAELFEEYSKDTSNTLEVSEEEINSSTLFEETKTEKENE